MKTRRSRSKPSQEPGKTGEGAPLPSQDAPKGPSRMPRKRELMFLGLVLLFGLLLRGLYLVEITHQPDFRYPVMDPQYNDYWARGMAFGEWTPPEGYPDPQIRTTPHGRPPGYPYFLAGVYSIFGPGYMAPRLVQMALGLVNGVLMFYLARAIFGSVVGLISAAFMVSYWVFIHFEGELTYPVVAVFALLLFMHALRWWTDKPTVWRAAVAGLLFGLFGLFRPNTFLFGPVLVAWFWWVLKGRQDWRRFLFCSAAVTIGTVAAIAPALIRNVAVAGDFVFLSSYGGVNLWIGNNPDTDCVTPKIPQLKEIAGVKDWTCFHYPLIVRGLGRHLGKEDLKFSEASEYFYGKAHAFILHHPLKTLQLTIKKALIFWGPTETTNDKILHWVKKKSPVLRLLPGFPFVLALFVVGLMLWVLDTLRDRRDALSLDGPGVALAIMFLLFIATYCASVIIYFVAGRYRIPVIPFLLMFGAYGVHRVAQFIAMRDYHTTAKWATAGVLTLGIGSIQFYEYTPDLAIWHQHRAKAFESGGDIAKAIEEVEKELSIAPAYADGYNYLGKLCEKNGDPQSAAEAYGKAIEIDPENYVALNNLAYRKEQGQENAEAAGLYARALEVNPQFGLAHNNLGNLLTKQGEYAAAIEHYAEALRIDPNDRFADYNMANALAAKGDLDEATVHYRRAMEVDPQNPDIPNNFGLALGRQGKSEEAVEQYRKAIQLDPAYANAYNNLAFELASQGETDEARQYYEKALELDPEFALAHNNLGSLCKQLGMTAEAVEHYGRALEIDPGDKNAYRNLGDLHREQGDFDKAIDAYTKAMENDPANPGIPNNLAICLVRKVRFDEAIRYYYRALEIDPEYLDAHVNLGSVLEALGQRDKAAEHFRKALEIRPGLEAAQEGLGRLEGSTPR